MAIERSRHRLVDRLFSHRGAVLLARNTVVSIGVFGFGLALLWLLVERLAWPKIPSAAVSFLAANSLHYVFGRTWIYRGTSRAIVQGYTYFIINSLGGLLMTLALFAAFIAVGMHYILARIVASVFVGLVLFVLNAVFNFRSL